MDDYRLYRKLGYLLVSRLCLVLVMFIDVDIRDRLLVSFDCYEKKSISLQL